MSKKILSLVFWFVGVGLVAYTLHRGSWALVVPGSVLLAALLFAMDLVRHRELVHFDRELARTFFHLMSAVSLASTCMWWLGRVLLG